MTPVISPWVFYLMPVCEKFSILAWVTFGLFAFALGVVGFICLCEWSSFNDEEIAMFKRILKTLLVVIVIAGLVACFIPSENTIVKMIVAQNVTFDRVEMVSDTVVTVYNDIMALFQDGGAGNG